MSTIAKQILEEGRSVSASSDMGTTPSNTAHALPCDITIRIAAAVLKPAGARQSLLPAEILSWVNSFALCSPTWRRLVDTPLAVEALAGSQRRSRGSGGHVDKTLSKLRHRLLKEQDALSEGCAHWRLYVASYLQPERFHMRLTLPLADDDYNITRKQLIEVIQHGLQYTVT